MNASGPLRALALLAPLLLAWEPIPVVDDPLVRMPGTQPEEVRLESPGRCLNCHGGYNPAIEPAFNWRGSMMGHAMRDPLFWATMAVAAQDSVWALGTPNATDLCLRCHSPQGWLEGRSDPTNGADLTGSDHDGVHCPFCHSMVDPFADATWSGAREGADWAGYWGESNASNTPSGPAADLTHAEDLQILGGLILFDGAPMYTDDTPTHAAWDESGAGQYVVSGDGDYRASFADANARHGFWYSRFHKSKSYCQACHDVSNPALSNLGADPNQPLPSETQAAYAYGHVERTSSEFMASAYGQQGGVEGRGRFAPDEFDTRQPDNKIVACQSCHMPTTTGQGAAQSDAIDRPHGSVEHPEHGQPVHDLSGGNAWTLRILASTIPDTEDYDAFNAGLLTTGSAALGLDLTAGDGLHYEALLAGASRAEATLGRAAAIEGLTYDAATGRITFRVENHTGHKLPSGYPEGRRVFLSARALRGGAEIWSLNPYDAASASLVGLPLEQAPNSPRLGPDQVLREDLIYEAQMTSALTGEVKTFHFVLATGRYKDNRIPPLGFDLIEAARRQIVPVVAGLEAPDLYTAEEYAGGYDAVTLDGPAGAEVVEVSLWYQTTSREYVEFLRDEVLGVGGTLSSPTPSGEAEAYIAQADPFFDNLRAWGAIIWDLYWHNRDLPGAAPILLAQATAVGECGGDSDGDGVLDCLDGCPDDPGKVEPGVCGCGVADADTDGDAVADCLDDCPEDPGKVEPGACGCGVADTDTDGDAVADCLDDCPEDPGKVEPGACGCGVADTDTDGDAVADCLDGCPEDPNKVEPGVCGCGASDADTDGDRVVDCLDGCPEDPNKVEPGACGCGASDVDSDGDQVADCHDDCPEDPSKVDPGACGCGVADTDTDGDETPDCHDGCPEDPGKVDPGACGCGVSDADTDEDGHPNCSDGCPFDPNKVEPGACGCGVVEEPGCGDLCPDDPDKTAPGVCGCGVPDTDTDADGAPDCVDGCPEDPTKVEPGVCGCGVADTDSDGDGAPGCLDGCPEDPAKVDPGACGCGAVDTDSDGDGVADCLDGCPEDPGKVAPGACGCGAVDTDSDGDSVADCHDGCPEDPGKVAPGVCGCGAADTDEDGDGVMGCVDACPGGDDASDEDGDGFADACDDCPQAPGAVGGCPEDVGGVDAGVVDAGVVDAEVVDAAPDAGLDATLDAEADAAPDAEADIMSALDIPWLIVDAMLDAAPDVEVDAAPTDAPWIVTDVMMDATALTDTPQPIEDAANDAEEDPRGDALTHEDAAPDAPSAVDLGARDALAEADRGASPSVDAAPREGDAAVSPDASDPAASSPESGCGCALVGASPLEGALWLLSLVGLAWARRRGARVR